jgi:hypothetical protein
METEASAMAVSDGPQDDRKAAQMRCAFAHSDIVFATEQGTSVAGPLWYWILEEAGQDAD